MGRVMVRGGGNDGRCAEDFSTEAVVLAGELLIEPCCTLTDALVTPSVDDCDADEPRLFIRRAAKTRNFSASSLVCDDIPWAMTTSSDDGDDSVTRSSAEDGRLTDGSLVDESK
jgi:hypothetical protein